MFGQQDKDDNHDEAATDSHVDEATQPDPAIITPETNEANEAPETGATFDPAAPAYNPTLPADPTPTTQPEPPTPASDWQHPGEPIADTETTPVTEEAEPAAEVEAEVEETPSAPPVPDEEPEPTPTPTIGAANEDLAAIKQKALEELSPLVDKLDLQPEEKFRTIMMLIQASDNQDLVDDAYTAAHSIEDEKVRAQALLDIVNEINYFTSQQQAEA